MPQPTKPLSVSGVSRIRSRAEPLVQALGRAEDAADAADVLADHDHVGIGRQLLLERLADRRDEAERPLARRGRVRVAAVRAEDRRQQVVGLASSSASAASIAASTSASTSRSTVGERVVVELASSRSALEPRQRVRASHSSTIAGSRTSGRLARIECCMRRNVFSSSSVGPSPARARSSARATASSTASDVVAVDDLAGHAVAGRALGDVLDRALRAPVGRERELVVLADEDDRQPPGRGEVHRLVHRALAGGAVAEERDDRLARCRAASRSAPRRTRAGCPAPTIPLQPRMSSDRSAMCIEPPRPRQ